MNIRYDDTVHARTGPIAQEFDCEPDMPLCGEAIMTVFAPELTTDDVNCIWCKSIID